ncbi:C2H2 type master regulator of conidiophore development brlA [Penicillium rolfsii]|nr:C2H2 type master regulator of conidiophore development brlA [Penicillium rolfsii]
MDPHAQTSSSDYLSSDQDTAEPCIQEPKTFYQTCLSPCNSHHAAGSFEYALDSLLPHPTFCEANQWSDMRMEELCQWNNSSNDFMTLQTVVPEQIFHQGPLVLHSSVGIPQKFHALDIQTSSTSNAYFETLHRPFAKGPPGELPRRPQRYAKGSESTPAYVEESSQQPQSKTSSKRPGEQNHAYKSIQHEQSPTTGNWLFKCRELGCKGRFKRQDHLKRHMKTHSNDNSFVCWVPGCQRGFSRNDNLTAHYKKTHARKGGRNRYVPSLDESSSLYDPEFRGQLAPDGSPLYTLQARIPVGIQNGRVKVAEET